MNEFFNDAPTQWAVLLGVALPLLTIILSEWLNRANKHNDAMAGPLRAIRNFVLPSVTLALLMHYVANSDSGQWPFQLVMTLALLASINAILSLLNALVFGHAAQDSWQAKMPKLLIDLLRSALVLIGLAIVLSTVWGADLGGIFTALGIGSIVIGLALQDSVGGLIKGILLVFERPFSTGDWLKIGDLTAQVVEVNWRAVHLHTGGKDLVVIPNANLAGDTIINLNRPTPLHVESVAIGFSYEDPPYRVKQLMLELLQSIPGILKEPGPACVVASYDNSCITYKLVFWTEHYGVMFGPKDELLSRIWYVAKRHGLSIPFPMQVQVPYITKADVEREASGAVIEGVRRLSEVMITEAGLLGGLQRTSKVLDFGKREPIVKQGSKIPGLYFILAGRGKLVHRLPDGREVELVELSEGDFFGESALISSDPSVVTVLTVEDMQVLLLDIGVVQDVLDRTPHEASEMSELIEARHKAVQLLYNESITAAKPTVNGVATPTAVR